MWRKAQAAHPPGLETKYLLTSPERLVERPDTLYAPPVNACLARENHANDAGSTGGCRAGLRHGGWARWDLADGSGRAVKVTADGWRIVDDAPGLFPTSSARGALSEPAKGGSIHGLRERFGLSAYNEALIILFCLGRLRGKGPYPILAIVGPESCGKTTLAAYLRALVDPATPMLRNMPKKDVELAISARDSHLLAYDGIEAVPTWFSRAICKVSKGTAFSVYLKGQEQILFQGARPVILAGTEEMLLNRELASRAMIVRLEPRTNFKSNMTEAFEGLAEMRGVQLDIVSHALSRQRDIEVPAPRKDFPSSLGLGACRPSSS